MGKASLNSIVFNLAGVAALAIVGGYVVTSQFKSGSVEQCSLRYPAGQQFVLDSEHGKPLTPEELQARAGLREWGVLRNARVVENDTAPGAKVLDVALARTDNEDQTDENGIGFVWPVVAMHGARSACLSYSVFLPKGFEFKIAGYLPGLFGATDLADLDAPKPGSGFAARVGWAPGGDAGIEVRSPTTEGYWQGAKALSTWPTGRWLAVEQEVQINTPDQADGILRLWVNGNLIVQNLGVTLRNGSDSGFSGVVADVGYARGASDPANVKISPFIVQWQ